MYIYIYIFDGNKNNIFDDQNNYIYIYIYLMVKQHGGNKKTYMMVMVTKTVYLMIKTTIYI